MSGAAIAARGVTEAAQATGRAERKGWLAELKEEALSFVKGDNNAPWAIFAETVIGCVPILGQVVDARDIIKGLVEVSGAPASPLAWFNLITALIGLVPGGGDAVKRSLRSIKSGAVHIDELLDMIRRFYKGNPEALLREVLDVSKLRKYLNDILDNPILKSRLGSDVRRSIDNIQANLNKQFDAFKKEVDGWLAKGRKTSAETGPAAKAKPGTPDAKPGTQAKAGTQGKGQHSDHASPNTPNAASQRTARFKSLASKFLGVMGEHMADYHCQDVKGWGKAVIHDQGLKNTAKLNDGGELVQLWPCRIRGRGIDAVWKSTGPKPYAIIEAKASYDPTKSLARLLGEAWDKTERSPDSGGSSSRGAGAGRRGTSNVASPTARQRNGKAMQMSKAWIEQRLGKSRGNRVGGEVIVREGYQRLVLFFSIPHAVAHAEALILIPSGRVQNPTFHSAHEVTREWRDTDIESVGNQRSGMYRDERAAKLKRKGGR